MTADDRLVDRARLEVRMAARAASDYAMELAADVDAPMSTYERIRSARRLRVDALTVLDRTVLAELLAGAQWGTVALALGLPEDEARRRYEDTLDSWRAELAVERRDS